MRHRGVRVTLVLLWLAALAAAGYGVLTAGQEVEIAAAAGTAYEQDAWRAALAIAELEGAERAAVAEGQSAEFWLARAARTRQDLDRGLARLRVGTDTPEAQRAIQEAGAVLRDFDGLDRRAREYLALGQSLLASDLIFADGRDMLRAAARHLETARMAQRARVDAQLADARRRQVVIAGSMTAATLLAVLLLAPAGSRPRPAASAPAAAAAEPPGAMSEPDRTIGAALDAQLNGRLAPAPSPPATRGAPPVDLQATAALCAELARVADTRDLSTLMARAAHVLGASGVVLWVADQTAATLVPAIAHGYPPEVVARLGTVQREADNATAMAYRAGRTQVVAGSPGKSGALIAPLVTAPGCAGVVAAELPHPREQDDAVRAVAEILAAQLATLVSPAPSAASATSAPASA